MRVEAMNEEKQLPSAGTESQTSSPAEHDDPTTRDFASTKSAEQPHFPVWQWVLTLTSLYLGALLYGLDTTIAADVQTAVYERFDDIKLLPWVGLGFPMGSVACILFFGRLYSMFDGKILMNMSVLLFEGGSALCAGAPNMTALIVGRVVAGIGGCGMYIGLLNFVSTLGSPKKLTLYNALIGVCWGTGAILGPVVGGAFSVSSATWRWAFYINLPLAALLSPIYLFVTPSHDPRPKQKLRNRVIDFDWIGVVLNGAFFVLLITVITLSGSTAWSSGTIVALWTVTGVVLVGYAIQQYFALGTTEHMRLFPVHFFKSIDLMLLYIATACAATSNAVTLYYIPIFFVFTRNDTALQAAIRLLPFIVVFIVCVMISGATLPITGRYAIYYIIGGALILSGSALLFTIRSDTSLSKIYGYEVLVAAGSGLCFQNAYAVAGAKTGKVNRHYAIGFINTAQIGTTALSLAIAACLYGNLGFDSLRDALSGRNLSADFIRAALGGAGAQSLKSQSPEVVKLVINSVAHTISRIFGMGIAAGTLLLVVSVLMKKESLELAPDAVASG